MWMTDIENGPALMALHALYTVTGSSQSVGWKGKAENQAPGSKLTVGRPLEEHGELRLCCELRHFELPSYVNRHCARLQGVVVRSYMPDRGFCTLFAVFRGVEVLINAVFRALGGELAQERV